MSPSPHSTCLIVGAGAAGLGAALELRGAGTPFEIWDSSARPGGVVGTLERGAFRFESGPNTVPATAGQVRWLCERLGVSDQLVTSSDRARSRYLFHKGRLQAVPLKPPELLRSGLLSPLGKLALLREPFRSFDFDSSAPEPTVHEFIARRFGREAADRFAGAFVRGIYAGDAKRLGLRSAFPRLWNLASEHGSVLKGMRAAARASEVPAGQRGKLLSLQGGFGTLVHAAREVLGDALRVNEPVVELTREGELWEARSASGRTARFASVILATPAPITASLLEAHEPTIPALLRSIRTASVHVLHLGFASRDAIGLPLGFGFLVPPDLSSKGPRMLGTIFASDLFDDRAPKGGGVLSMIYNAKTLDDAAGEQGGLHQDPASLVAVALEDLRRAGASPPEPTEVAGERWTDALPQYEVGHSGRIDRVLSACSALPGLTLAGNYLRGIGLDDAVASGRKAALT